MKSSKNVQLPFGVQDYLPEECYNKKLIEQALSKSYSSFGYDRIEPPSIEFFDTFAQGLSQAEKNRMFKLFDSDGSILVLRPDLTMQIARICATKLSQNPINKLYYFENSFEFSAALNTAARTREFAQGGVELVGDTKVEGDVEVLTIAIESLKTSGLKGFQIELGQIGFISGALNQIKNNNISKQILLDFIKNKDASGLENYLKKKEIKNEIIDFFANIPLLFGGSEIFEKALKLCKNYLPIIDAIQNLKATYDILCRNGYAQYLSVDLGLVQDPEYYTGIIFKGFAEGVGSPILEGGRYDNLTQSFGKRIPATGFAIGIKRLMIALEKANLLCTLSVPDYAYIEIEGGMQQNQYIMDLRKKGFKVTRCFFDNQAQLIDYCKKTKIKRALIFDKGVREIEL